MDVNQKLIEGNPGRFYFMILKKAAFLSIFCRLSVCFFTSRASWKKPLFSELLFLTLFYVLFFFAGICDFFLCILFFWKSLSLTQSLISNVYILLFPVSEKKFTVFLLTNSILLKMSQKKTFSKLIIKYGTFDENNESARGIGRVKILLI